MERPWDFTSLDRLAERIWTELTFSVEDVSHPWRTPVLATSGIDGPSARLVVLRSVIPAKREWVAFSDSRASKLSEVLADGASSWVFYDSRFQVQLRARAHVTAHLADPPSAAAWERVPAINRIHYRRRVPPGQPIHSPADGWSVDEDAEANFGMLVAHVESLDLLALNPSGHIRAQFRWCDLSSGSGWTGQWVAP